MTSTGAEPHTFTPIATLYTCFKEKFGIPRQMNLVPSAKGRLVFDPAFANVDAVRELEKFSHIWLIFLFHQTLDKAWSTLVRPPRLGGNKKAGVFATRSPFRPNPIGISAVKLEGVENSCDGPVLHLSGVDIVNETPVLDIKPYIPWADAIVRADGGFADNRPASRLQVIFSSEAQTQCRKMTKQIPDLASLIIQILENDPRPGYRAEPTATDKKIYGIRLYDLDVKWQVTGRIARVIRLDHQA